MERVWSLLQFSLFPMSKRYFPTQVRCFCLTWTVVFRFEWRVSVMPQNIVVFKFLLATTICQLSGYSSERGYHALTATKPSKTCIRVRSILLRQSKYPDHIGSRESIHARSHAAFWSSIFILSFPSSHSFSRLLECFRLLTIFHTILCLNRYLKAFFCAVKNCLYLFDQSILIGFQFGILLNSSLQQ